MDQEVQQVADVVADSSPAPELEATAAPETAEATPEAPAKTFTQEEVDALVSKRLAREQRKWERQRQTQPGQTQPSAVPELAPPESFENVEAYAQALAERKAQELLVKQQEQQQRQQLLEAYHDREEKARDRYADFEQVAYNPNLRITDVMAEAIQASDTGPEVAYYLGQNPKEAERISRLQPTLQAKEIGKLEAKLSLQPPENRTTSAPEPVRPVTARASNTTYDTTDPRSIKSMSTSEWIEAERQRQIRKAQASR